MKRLISLLCIIFGITAAHGTVAPDMWLFQQINDQQQAQFSQHVSSSADHTSSIAGQMAENMTPAAAEKRAYNNSITEWDEDYYKKGLVYFYSHAVDKVLSEMISDSVARQAASDEYYKNVKDAHGKITGAGLVSVCDKAGWSETEYYTKCTELFNKLKRSIAQFYDVCNADRGKTGVGTDHEHCIEDFKEFSVPHASAVKIVEEYMKRYGAGTKLDCSENVVVKGIVSTSWDDAYLKCATRNRKDFYTFRFDRLNEADGEKNIDGVVGSVCKLYKLRYDATTNDCFGDVNVSVDVCTDVEKALSAFGPYKVTADKMATGLVGDGTLRCRVRSENSNDKVKLSSLKNPYNINPLAFYKTKTIYDTDVKNRLIQYIDQSIKNFSGIVNVKNIYCDSGFEIIEDEDTGTMNTYDYMVHCHADDADIVFVFDDLSNGFNDTANAGKAGMDCVIAGGTYREKCYHLTEEMCNQVKTTIAGGAEWDAANEVCVLKDSEIAHRLETQRNIVNGVVITVAMMPIMGVTGAWALVGATVGEVGLSIAMDVSFDEIEKWKNTMPTEIVNEFLAESNGCEQAACAKEILTKYAATLVSFKDLLGGDPYAKMNERSAALRALITDSDEDDIADKSEILSKVNLATLAQTGVLAAGFVINPSRAAINKGDDVARLANKGDNIADAARGLRILSKEGRQAIKVSIKNWFKELKATILFKLNGEKRHLQNYAMKADGAQVSSFTRSYGEAWQEASKLSRDNYYAVALGIDGSSQDRHIIIAIDKETYKTLGRTVEPIVHDNIEKLGREIPEAITRIRRAEQMADEGRVIATIHGKPAKLVSVGQVSGRPIAVVDINGIEIPFYVSSGTAGKTAVPTGKWEVFAGFGTMPGKKPGNLWFRKGGIKAINSHYGSYEFQEIASALDRTLGDLRDTELVLESVGRAQMGGNGIVAVAMSENGLRHMAHSEVSASTDIVANLWYNANGIKQTSNNIYHPKAEDILDQLSLALGWKF